jgi:hypothetical protein
MRGEQKSPPGRLRLCVAARLVMQWFRNGNGFHFENGFINVVSLTLNSELLYVCDAFLCVRDARRRATQSTEEISHPSTFGRQPSIVCSTAEFLLHSRFPTKI